LWCAPRLAVPDEGVEDDHELAHGGDERELFGFAGGDQAAVEGAQRRVVSDRPGRRPRRESARPSRRARPVRSVVVVGPGIAA
jgi:hypothetical protein